MKPAKQKNCALSTYIQFLKVKAVFPDIIAVRADFLDKMTLDMEGLSKNRLVYANALNRQIRHSKNTHWHEYMQAAREFYPFWMHDARAIHALSDAYHLNVQDIEWHPLPTTLKAIADRLQTEIFSEKESVWLEQYLRLLQKEPLDRKAMMARVQLAKILVIRLRDVPAVNNFVYRMAVDVTLPLFRMRVSRQLFLTVVREFFYIWMAEAGGASGELVA
jgi:hypothetical protein